MTAEHKRSRNSPAPTLGEDGGRFALSVSDSFIADREFFVNEILSFGRWEASVAYLLAASVASGAACATADGGTR